MEKNSNKVKIKEWLSDRWDDLVWYVYDKPMDIYKTVRHWIYTCGRYKSHWKFAFDAMFHNYPWDFSYFYNIQYDWIKKSYDYFKTNSYCSEDKTNSVLKYQKICLGLLEIINEKREFWSYDLEKKEVVMHIPFNLRNKDRFPALYRDYNGRQFLSSKNHDRFPEEYYKTKAQYLYYKIISERISEWWD
jgi:hypothetical protein